MENKKSLLILFGLISIIGTCNLNAQETIRLFPKGAPGETVGMVEKSDKSGAKVGGEPVERLSNVSEPSITVFSVSGSSSKTSAVVVCPGGGYNILAYDLEGEEVCRWLNSIGITGVLLKYRVPRRAGREKHDAPLQDVQRAISYVRANVSKYNVDPNRIGVMGFSAGAHLAVMSCSEGDRRSYEPLGDGFDDYSCRPDFCLLVYPAYLDGGSSFVTSPEIRVSEKTPPTMLVQAEDDKPYIRSSLYYYHALLQAGVPAVMHLYSRGGHGYGLRDTGASVNEWPARAEDWFREIAVINF